MTNALEEDSSWMQLAIQIALQGQGVVEPNPMVGCVIVRDGKELARGFHREFGGNHAEVEALNACDDVEGATVFVSLEPCCHHGKTPPCVDRLIEAKVARVVVAHGDPFFEVMGGGIEKLQEAGIHVDVGILRDQARQLNAPYLKRVKHGRPWVIAKWAMTLDGKIATRTGDSKWISSEASRKIVHDIRGRMDAIIVGSQTAVSDDPLLTARPPGPRTATRIVVDSELKTSLNSKLVRSAREFPTLFAVGPESRADGDQRAKADALRAAGCEILHLPSSDHNVRIGELLDELGRRDFTNVLVEGGAGLLGGFFDLREVDEVHVFIGNRLVGGGQALTAVRGTGAGEMSDAFQLEHRNSQVIGDDVYVSGRVKK